MVVPNANISGPPGVATQPANAKLLDLQTGATTSVPLPPDGSRAIASNGAVLTTTGVWKDGTITPVTYRSTVPDYPFPSAILSDDGSTIIYASLTQLISHDIASGNETVIPGNIAPRLFSVSASGRYVLYSASTFTAGQMMTQAFVADTVTGQSYLIPLDGGESLTAGALNSSGTLAFLGTSEGRAVKVSLTSGQSTALTEILPRVTYLTNLTQPVSPGSLARFSGYFTADAASVQGKLLIDGQPLQVLSAGSGAITAQIPWEVRAGTRMLQLNLPSASPFYQASSVNVVPMWFQFEMADTRQSLLGIKFLNEDFSGLAVDPLPAGATLHAYATGLGPVNGSVQTGVSVAAGAVIPIEGSITCQFLPQKSNAMTLFAGLAPSLLGIYQIDFQLADEGTPVTVTGINCTIIVDGVTGIFRASGPTGS
jgi:uncharacterized protein (TIGR03437 family)